MTVITIKHNFIIPLAEVTSKTLKNENWFSKNVWSHIDIPLYGLCVDIGKETFSNRNRRCLIDRFIKQLCFFFFARVHIFNSMSFFKQLSE